MIVICMECRFTDGNNNPKCVKRDEALTKVNFKPFACINKDRFLVLDMENPEKAMEIARNILNK